MKDMSVKELIVKCGVGWNDFKAEKALCEQEKL